MGVLVGCAVSVVVALGTACPMMPTGLPLTFVALVRASAVVDVVGFARGFFTVSWGRTVCTFCTNGDDGEPLGLGVETFDG